MRTSRSLGLSRDGSNCRWRNIRGYRPEGAFLSEEFAAEQAGFPVAAAGAAMFAAVEDDLEVEAVPVLAGEEFFQVAFGLFDVFP